MHLVPVAVQAYTTRAATAFVIFVIFPTSSKKMSCTFLSRKAASLLFLFVQCVLGKLKLLLFANAFSFFQCLWGPSGFLVTRSPHIFVRCQVF